MYENHEVSVVMQFPNFSLISSFANPSKREWTQWFAIWQRMRHSRCHFTAHYCSDVFISLPYMSLTQNYSLLTSKTWEKKCNTKSCSIFVQFLNCHNQGLSSVTSASVIMISWCWPHAKVITEFISFRSGSRSTPAHILIVITVVLACGSAKSTKQRTPSEKNMLPWSLQTNYIFVILLRNLDLNFPLPKTQIPLTF